MALLIISASQNNKNNVLQYDAGRKIGTNIPADQCSPNDHASCPSGSVRTSAGDGGT